MSDSPYHQAILDAVIVDKQPVLPNTDFLAHSPGERFQVSEDVLTDFVVNLAEYSRAFGSREFSQELMCLRIPGNRSHVLNSLLMRSWVMNSFAGRHLDASMSVIKSSANSHSSSKRAVRWSSFLLISRSSFCTC